MIEARKGNRLSEPLRGTLAAVGLFLRGLVWTLLFPGVVAGYVPWRFFGLRLVDLDVGNPVHWLGVATAGAGAALLATCIIAFGRHGRGTLSPVDPARHLVVQGLYRHVRNPMYLSVTLIHAGEFLLTRSLGLLAFWAIWFAVVNAFIFAYEEPTLRRQFGAEYEEYAAAVPRWLPRPRPWRSGTQA